MSGEIHEEPSVIGASFLADFGLTERPDKAEPRESSERFSQSTLGRTTNTSSQKSSGRQSLPDDDGDVAGALFDDFRDQSLRAADLDPASTHARSALNSQSSRGSLGTRAADQDEEADQDRMAPFGLLSRHDLRSASGLSLPGMRLNRLPQAGDEIFGFRLKQPLGQGAFARVFLAEQVGLAGRPVVVKTSDLTGSEPQTLAQLQHTNIVPIFSVHEDDDSDLRAVCMPYFGGASLSQVLKSVIEHNERPQHGREIVEALERVGAPVTQATSLSDAAHTLRGLSYLNACGWVVARLAEGLQHAHERGVLHRDIKPANVLLTADGTPMLLDFNLSHDEQQSHSQVETTLGGTLSYMAPEHLRALNSRSAEMIKKVDERSDIYGLGMVLFELITGRSAFQQSASCGAVPILIEAMANERSKEVPSLRAVYPSASWGYESILRKCLHPEPEQRYQRADELAEDLSRLIVLQPLKYAPELSQFERFAKWGERHPRFMPSVTITTLAVSILALGQHSLATTRANLAATQQRAHEAEGAEARELKQRFQRGLQQALCFVNTHSALEDHRDRGIQICEETLGLYGVLQRPDWQQQVAWQRLETHEQQQLAEDIRELLLLLAMARTVEEQSTASVDLLVKAKSIPGLKPSVAILQFEAQLLRAQAQPDRAVDVERAAALLKPESARDFYQLATTTLQSDRDERHRTALAFLRSAIKADPRHYWSWMQKGLCHLELGEQHQALSDFSVCIGLWPEFAWGYFNRAYALNLIGDRAAAIDDYSEAIERDPKLLVARHNRGVARLELREFALALDDFNSIKTSSVESLSATRRAEVQALRGQAFEGLHQYSEADAAFAEAFADPAALLPSVRHQMSCAYGFAVYQRLPEQAESAFRSIDARDVRYPDAVYGRGLLAAERGEPARAMRYFKEAIAARPTFDEPRRFLAILLAREGKLTEAVAAINESLTLNPNSGPAHYAAACVSALAAQQTTDAEPSRQAKLEALKLLGRALELGYGHQAPSDSDLSALHALPEFISMLRSMP